MKKYTNKILLITFLVLLVVSCVGVTIIIQHTCRVHPEYFRPTEDKSTRKAVFISIEGDTLRVIEQSAISHPQPACLKSDTVVIIDPDQMDSIDMDNFFKL